MFFQIQNNSDHFWSHFNSVTGLGDNFWVTSDPIILKRYVIKFSYKKKMQNLGFVYELYMLLILKNCLVSFSKPTFLFWHGSLMTQWVKAILMITQKSYAYN